MPEFTMTDRFQHAMRLMRRHDPQARENGFHLLLPNAAEHVDALIAELSHERDHGLRCWLIELIGEARSPRSGDILTEHLHGDDAELRSWAARGLEKLNTKAARHELWKARANGVIPRPDR